MASKELESKDETSPLVIIRLSDVLQRTGLSRSTIYNRIARNEFPRQVSLGARAVGWIEQEIERWIAERSHLRPGPQGHSVSCIASDTAHSIWKETDIGRPAKNRQRDEIRFRPTGKISSGDGGLPDLAHLQLVATRLYIDRNTGAFWLQIFPNGAV